MADGEADDRCAAGASQRHTEESCLCGDADGFCPTGPDFSREQVREHWGEQRGKGGGVLSLIPFVLY